MALSVNTKMTDTGSGNSGYAPEARGVSKATNNSNPKTVATTGTASGGTAAKTATTTKAQDRAEAQSPAGLKANAQGKGSTSTSAKKSTGSGSTIPQYTDTGTGNAKPASPAVAGNANGTFVAGEGSSFSGSSGVNGGLDPFSGWSQQVRQLQDAEAAKAAASKAASIVKPGQQAAASGSGPVNMTDTGTSTNYGRSGVVASGEEAVFPSGTPSPFTPASAGGKTTPGWAGGSQFGGIASDLANDPQWQEKQAFNEAYAAAQAAYAPNAEQERFATDAARYSAEQRAQREREAAAEDIQTPSSPLGTGNPKSTKNLPGGTSDAGGSGGGGSGGSGGSGGGGSGGSGGTGGSGAGGTGGSTGTGAGGSGGTGAGGDVGAGIGTGAGVGTGVAGTTGGLGGETAPYELPTIEGPNPERIDQVDTTELRDMLQQIIDTQKQQSEQAIDYNVQKETDALNRAMEDAATQYQTQRSQIAADERQALDNQALYAEARGDRGGIGEAQYNSIQAAANQNRRAVNDAQVKLSTDTARQISDLRAQGEFEKADQLLSLTQSYLSQLMSLEQWALQANLGVDEFNSQLQQWVDEYNLNVQQYLTDLDLSAANLTGMFSNGNLTRASQNQILETLASAGSALLNAGVVPSAQQLQAMGMTEEQAKAYIKKIKK